jgi:beta-xylosidase
MADAEKRLNSEPWVSDQGDGTYVNPVLYADYSDPDVIRVGDDFYMTASSFGHIPGLPILHSNDLVNWKLVNHVIPRMELPDYDKPQHGNGVWAPSLRYHDGKYWVYYGDPDVGIFMSTATDPAGEWEPLHLVHAGKGLIDTCPFWDDDGQAYLVHAYANSRAGIKHKLRVRRMSADGRRLLDEGQIVYDNPDKHPTLEGPKMYKRNGYYYIFAPAGGVATGWQTIFRAKNVFGPYEERIVLHQGDSPVNGPHQGGWVELESGESWFVHFQDIGPYGRVVHLQPVHWQDDWPLMGVDSNGDGIGEPVLRYRKPNVGRREYPIAVPSTSDEFDGTALGLQWQWQANPLPAWYELGVKPSSLRLHAVSGGVDETGGLYRVPQLLMQKLPAPSFAAEAKLELAGLAAGDRAGVIVFGYKYAYLGVRRGQGGGCSVVLAEGDANGERELWSAQLPAGADALHVRVAIEEGARCAFSYSVDGTEFKAADAIPFQATEGHWVGAKVGLFAVGAGQGVGAASVGSDSASGRTGYVDADWFRVSRLP